MTLRRAPVDAPVYRSTIVVNENLNPRPPSHRFAISPDGRRLAYVATDATGRLLLWVRSFEGSDGQSLAGTDGANAPFWSPDSRFSAFFVDGNLKKIAAGGGTPIAICDAPTTAQRATPGSWNRDDVIVFPVRDSSPLSRVSAAGGTPSAVTTLDSHAAETQHGFPFFLPDGRHFLYVAFNDLVPLGVAAPNPVDGRRVEGAVRSGLSVLTRGAARVDVEAVRPLFEMRAPEGLARYFYDVSSDGQRFLLSAPEVQTTFTPLTLVTNWPALLKKDR